MTHVCLCHSNKALIDYCVDIPLTNDIYGNIPRGNACHYLPSALQIHLEHLYEFFVQISDILKILFKRTICLNGLKVVNNYPNKLLFIDLFFWFIYNICGNMEMVIITVTITSL